MATVNKRIVGPALLTNAAATKYTCGVTRTTIRRIRVNNPSGGAVGFTLSIGADAAGTRLWDAASIPSGGSINDYGPLTLENGDIIQALGSSTNVLVLTINGEEIS